MQSMTNSHVILV